MDKLTYELRVLCKRNRDGSHGTQAQRKKRLRLIAKQLKKLGFRQMGAKSLKATHVKELEDYWLTKPSKLTGKLISAGTIKNRMSALRWWTEQIDRKGVIPKDNRALNRPNRKRLSKHNKAFKLTPKLLKGEEIQLAEAERAVDQRARLIVSQGLGHGRIEIIRTYLG